MDILDVLGIDEKDFVWQDLAACDGMERNLFFDDYENDEIIAKQVDELCAGCPVRDMCLLYGLEHKETGVWGGIYLNGRGGIDKSKLGHKSIEEQERLKAL